MLEYIEEFNKSGQKPERLVVWLHGLGANCNDFVPLIAELKLNKAVKFIFPNAPLRPITINNGYTMRGWYDIRSLTDLRDDIDTEAILVSVKQIEEIITNQIQQHGFSTDQIVIAGFSQGGVISYVTAILSQYKFAGIMALSCYLPHLQYNLSNSINLQTPIFAAHGVQDNVVPLIAGTNARQKLVDAGFNLAWHEYTMPHSVCAEEVVDINNWLNTVF